ncbi:MULTISPECIES: response regulator transcription factor [Streptomyces]|uniref:Response regulator transcription factor n=1 Tax=Streptomyces ramulosus TaxID=47762 RepID=A0ABW1FI68_9ACTN
MSNLPAPTSPLFDDLSSLTPREREVLGHLVQGETYRTIARRMGLSPHTVDTYLRRLRSKTGATNRTQLVALAFRLGY